MYFKGLLHGDLGFSYTYRRPVSEDRVGERLVQHVRAAGGATLLVMALGIALGVWAAARRGSKGDSATVISSLVLWSMPTFWTGMLLLFAFGVWLHVAPDHRDLDRRRRTTARRWVRRSTSARHLILPTITLVMVDIGQFVLITRSSLVDVLTEDFMTTAKAKGMSHRRVVWGHAVRNGMLPVVTATALYVGIIVGGAIQVETVFSWPGMGELTTRRCCGATTRSSRRASCVRLHRDHRELPGDLLYRVLDPRVKEA